MKNISDQTAETYQQNFAKYVARTPSEPSGEFKLWMDAFLSRLPAGGQILELGSASGRDARYFAGKGYKIFCTDIIPQALENLSRDGFETAPYDFRDAPTAEWLGKFDGFFANAVLLHAPLDVFKSALRNAAAVLKKDGIAAFSLKAGEGEEVTSQKMDAPRYFRYYTETGLRDIVSQLPFEIISMAYADEKKWLHTIMKIKK